MDKKHGFLEINYKDVFALNEAYLGKTHLVRHNIETDGLSSRVPEESHWLNKVEF